jgi:hypothetical protein
VGLALGVLVATGCGGSKDTAGPEANVQPPAFKITLTPATATVGGTPGTINGQPIITCALSITATATGGATGNYARWSSAVVTWTLIANGAEDIYNFTASDLSSGSWFGADSLAVGSPPVTAHLSWWDLGPYMVAISFNYRVMPSGEQKSALYMATCR